MSRTRVVATYGPACESPAVLAAMLRAGLDVVRLNVSHLDPARLGVTVAHVRAIARRAGMPLAVLADMPGPKIRLTACEPESFVVGDGDMILASAAVGAHAVKAAASGRAVTARITPGRTDTSTPKRLYIQYPHLLDDVKAGHELAINDGLVRLRVEKVDARAGVLRCRVLLGGTIASRKGVSFIHSTLRIQGLTPRDRAGLAAAAAAQVDFAALSFVRTAADIAAARRILRGTAAPDLPLVAKIEQHEAVDRIDEILRAADGIMVARGDMGIERPLEEVPLLQKDIIRGANRLGRYVITATQMLESMIEHSRPTRAEASDVANAILDGSDAVMLSAESATGAYPALAVETMTRIARTAESRVDGAAWLAALGPVDHELADGTAPQLDDALARATCRLALDAHLDAIVCLTFYGTTARRVARYRPSCAVYALGPNEQPLRRLALTWGVEAFRFGRAISPGTPADRSASHLIEPAVALLRQAGKLRKGDRVAFLAGIPLNTPGGTNSLRVITV